jgi:3D (Asp-Asp-Asp) domain-containing protein
VATVANKAASHGVARVTLYNKHEDKYGDRIAASNRRRAKVARTVAAESCCFPFGTKVFFPALAGFIGSGVFTVEDRGSAVERRKASHGKCPVIDIYAGTKRQMKHWAAVIPPYLEYEIK